LSQQPVRRKTVDLRESLDRVLKQQAMVAEQFYSLFLDRYPEERRHFEGINLRRQALMLSVALVTVERHSTGSYPAVEMYMRYLGTRHLDRHIEPESYAKFRDALLATLERFHDKEWDADLASQWGQALDGAVDTMLEGYRERFHV
jgi:hemoglobin-like flavoprotein